MIVENEPPNNRQATLIIGSFAGCSPQSIAVYTLIGELVCWLDCRNDNSTAPTGIRRPGCREAFAQESINKLVGRTSFVRILAFACAVEPPYYDIDKCIGWGWARP